MKKLMIEYGQLSKLILITNYLNTNKQSATEGCHAIVIDSNCFISLCFELFVNIQC